MVQQGCLPDPNLGQLRKWQVPVPPSWNQRYRRTETGGVAVREAVERWDTEATLMIRAQGWQAPAIGKYWGLGVEVYGRNDVGDLDKRIPTLVDWLKRADILGVDDKWLKVVVATKEIDAKNPRLLFAVWEVYAAA